MEIMEEVKFPAKDNEWIKKIIIGGILMIIPIINFIVIGYILKVMKGAAEGNPAMPKWEGVGGLFVKGIMVLIIVLIYMIIPLLIIGISASGVISAAMSGNMDMLLSSIEGAAAGVLIGLLLALIVSLIMPMALAIYAKEDSVGAAFRIGEVLSRIKSVPGDYIKVIIVWIVLEVILGVLAIIPILGILIAIFGGFYISVAIYNMFGKVYAGSSA